MMESSLRTAEVRRLHVLNGDATRLKLERSSVAGSFAVWADVLHDGPCLLVSDDEWIAVRTQYLASVGYGDRAALRAAAEGWFRQLARYGEFHEIVFWFEHDLFDQLLLIRHLHWLREITPRASPAFSLICIGEFAGVSDFVGLGQLSPEQLASLLDTRHRLTEREIDVGAAAWESFCATDPSACVEFLRRDSSALPFLDGALRRVMAEYPGRTDGLSRSERQILEAVSAGAAAPIDAFLATQRMEERIFMGDTTFWRIARSLMRGRVPLLEFRGSDAGLEEDADARGGMPGVMLPRGELHLTPTGRRVLDGKADYVELNGIDRWIGGVHLQDGRWRWDGNRIVTLA